MRAKKELGTDSRGTYRRAIGWEFGPSGKMRPHTFYLGKSLSEARVRNLRLEALWECVEARWMRAKAEGRAEACPQWDDLTVEMGLAVARGDTICTLPVPAGVEVVARRTPEVLTMLLAEYQRDFPVIPLRLAHPLFQQGVEAMQQQADNLQSKIDRLEELREFFEPAPSGSIRGLHAALDAYGVHIQATRRTADNRPSAFAVTQGTYIKTLKRHHPDMLLGKFDQAAIEKMVAYWTARPTSARTDKPVSLDFVREIHKFLRRFVKWLHRSPEFDWRRPADLEWEFTRIPITQAERNERLRTTQVDTFSLEELTTLYEYARPMSRLLMVLALNCGFGQAEVGSLLLDEIFLDQPHPHFGTGGSWIRRLRGKTEVYGEWKLWPVTVEGIRWQQPRRTGTAPQLILTREGRPLLEPTENHNNSQRINNQWTRLLDRVQKDYSNFRRLSFNKLRKTAGDLVRCKVGGEVASVFLAHGQPTKDELLEAYTNRPFSRVFEACDCLADYLGPMFAKVADTFPAQLSAAGPQISLQTISRIKEMRGQSYKLSKIAEVVGVSLSTVKRYLGTHQ